MVKYCLICFGFRCVLDEGAAIGNDVPFYVNTLLSESLTFKKSN